MDWPAERTRSCNLQDCTGSHRCAGTLSFQVSWLNLNESFIFFWYQTFWAIPRWDWTALVTSFSLEKPSKTIYSHVFDPFFYVFVYRLPHLHAALGAQSGGMYVIEIWSWRTFSSFEDPLIHRFGWQTLAFQNSARKKTQNPTKPGRLEGKRWNIKNHHHDFSIFLIACSSKNGSIGWWRIGWLVIKPKSLTAPISRHTTLQLFFAPTGLFRICDRKFCGTGCMHLFFSAHWMVIFSEHACASAESFYAKSIFVSRYQFDVFVSPTSVYCVTN